MFWPTCLLPEQMFFYQFRFHEFLFIDQSTIIIVLVVRENMLCFDLRANAKISMTSGFVEWQIPITLFFAPGILSSFGEQFPFFEPKCDF